MDLYCEILDGRLNLDSLKISRFGGWASFSTSSNSPLGQLSLYAGSGFLNNIPLQNLSLVSEYVRGETTITARSGLSGFTDAYMTFDTFKKNNTSQSFLSARGKDLGQILKTINKDNNKKISDTLLSTKDFFITALSQPELQFEDGPITYFVLGNLNKLSAINGTVLMYPDNGDVRGSLDINNDYIKAFQSYFNIPDDSITNNHIRLDETLKY